MSRVPATKNLLPSIESAIQNFTTSSAGYRILRTVGATNPPEPRALLILDSSFNPPSIAHLNLVTSAFKNQQLQIPRPSRLVLLFSTAHAEKKADQKVFAERLAMVTLLAHDMYDQLSGHDQKSFQDLAVLQREVAIDIALTNAPYYNDKSTAIVETEPKAYPSNPVHVHLIGYDNLLRILNPKYYTDHQPPLSALAPFFTAGHRLLVKVRPQDASDQSSDQFGSVEQQQSYLQDVRNGKLKEQGFDSKWADQIEMVDHAEGVTTGVSSTRIRAAVAAKDWEQVKKLCSPSVASWLSPKEANASI